MWARLAKMSTFHSRNCLRQRLECAKVSVNVAAHHLARAVFDNVDRYGMLSYSNAGTLLEQFNQYQQVCDVVERFIELFRIRNNPVTAGHRVLYWSH
jgi:hypothetical protein